MDAEGLDEKGKGRKNRGKKAGFRSLRGRWNGATPWADLEALTLGLAREEVQKATQESSRAKAPTKTQS